MPRVASCQSLNNQSGQFVNGVLNSGERNRCCAVLLRKIRLLLVQYSARTLRWGAGAASRGDAFV